MKSASGRYSLSVRLPAQSINRIEKSGENPSDWLRQAVQLRIEREQQASATVENIETRIGRLERDSAIIQREIAKIQQTQAVIQNTLAAFDKSFGDALGELFQGLSQQFDHAINKAVESINQHTNQAISRLLSRRLR